MKTILTDKTILIGMIHLPPSPGFLGHPGRQAVVDFALQELETLSKAGFQGALLENEHDKPHQITASPEVIASMTEVALYVNSQAKIAVGVEVLLNDPKASLAIAAASKSTFIRTDYFVDKMYRAEYEQEMTIDPKGLLDYRQKINAEKIAIFADIQVKYAQLLEEGKTISTSAIQAKKAGASALIVSGKITGDQPSFHDVKEAKAAVGDFPVLIGSGFSADNARELLKFCNGAIVGTSIKTGDHLDYEKAARLSELVFHN